MKFIVKHNQDPLKEFDSKEEALDFACSYAKEHMHESIGIFNETKRLNGFYHMKIL